MRRAVLLAPLLLLGASGARAQGIDMSRGGPVEVTASDGMEWRQNEQVVVARGNARAVRGDVTVTADRLTARYRRKAGQPAAQPASASKSASPNPASNTAAPGIPGTGDGGANEIYRLEADGNVHIFTATDMVVGDRAIYDIDQAVLVMTGKDMRLTTPQQVMTARDVMEYWSQKRMAVGRGEATVTTQDGRRVAADTLVGYLTDPTAPGAKPAAAPAAAPGKAPSDPLAASGKLERVEGFGNVEVRTAAETIRGARGAYVPDTGIARLLGNVRITRGQNQLNGDEAVVNMRTGVSTLTRGPAGRVQGLVVPNDPANKAEPGKQSPTPPTAQPRGRP